MYKDTHKNNINNTIFKLNERLIRSKVLTKIIFGIDIVPLDHPNCQFWDFSTLILKKALNKYVKNGQNILEIGTGHLGLLSLYIAKKREVDITAVDINPFFIQNARKNATKNNLDIDFIQSDLFEKINSLYDCIFFNPPYVPTNWMLQNHKELISNSIYDLTWDGGIDGCATIQNFLKKINQVTHNESTILLGANTLFVSYEKISYLIQEYGLYLQEVMSSFWNPCRVYVIMREGH